MNGLFKFWLFVVVFCLCSALLVKWVYSEDMIVEHSLVYQKNGAPMNDLSELFSQLGVTPPVHGRANPCFDLGNYTKKYCTVHSLKVLLNEQPFVSVEDQLLKKFLKSKAPCEQVGEYIGRVCEMNNFKKIFKHFALEK